MKSTKIRLRLSSDSLEESFELVLTGEDGKRYQHVTGPESTPAAKKLSKQLLVAIADRWPRQDISFNGQDESIRSVT